jgi:hypothetical protein
MLCAEALQAGPRRPRDIKPHAPDAGKILLSNVYGWFDRVEPGLYQLSELGWKAVSAAGEQTPPVL